MLRRAMLLQREHLGVCGGGVSYVRDVAWGTRARLMGGAWRGPSPSCAINQDLPLRSLHAPYTRDADPLHGLIHPTHTTPSQSRRPDGQKKAYVRLTADYDALDVANKIGII